jgi:hypothetical protein
MMPAILAGFAFLIGAGLIVGGVFYLAGTGWAMVTAGVWFIAIFGVLTRGGIFTSE